MKIIVVSPHQDDETLGAGGTLLKLKQEGNQIYWLNITAASRESGWDPDFVSHREIQVKKVAAAFGFDDVQNLNFPPAALGSEIPAEKIIQEINDYFIKIKPDWIILPDYNDVHSDHRITYECCISCSKIFRHPTIKRITTMEILSETDYGTQPGVFIPNLFVDISDFMEQKIEILKLYDTEIAKPPFPRSLEAVRSLATVRGAASGANYAEGFRIIKMIEG